MEPTELPDEKIDLTGGGSPMTMPQKAPRSKPTAFTVALTSALLIPVFGLLFMLLIFVIAPQGPEGLVVIVGIIGFILSIPFAGVVLIVIAITAAIARKLRAKPEGEGGTQSARNAERVGYSIATVLAVAPPVIAILLGLSALITGASAYISTPNQSEAKVKQIMESSLSDASYTTLPGYQKAGGEITVNSHKDQYSPTTYTAAATVNYTGSKVLSEGPKRLIAKGWTCRTGKVAAVIRKEEVAATGLQSPNSSCSKAGREVLNFTYSSSESAILSATTDGKLADLNTPSDYTWCKSHDEGQSVAVQKACTRILGEDEAYELSKFGLTQKCYAQVNESKSFDAKPGKLTKQCFDEYQSALERFQEARDNGTLSLGVEQSQR